MLDKIFCKLTYMDESIGQRIKRMRRARNLTQEQVGNHCNVSREAVSSWEKGTIKRITGENLLRLATLFETTPAEILTGQPLRSSDKSYSDLNQPILNGPNVELMPGKKLGKVPLISWVAAGAMKEAIDNFQPGYAEEWVETAAPIHQHTFALRVRGDSMAPKFYEGMVIIVEPDRAAVPGNYVIARNGDHEATFKQLVQDGSDYYLKPVNPQYPTKVLTPDTIICGVVIRAELDLT